MSGGRVPYHLRTHKAIDRHVFIDVLTRVHGYKSIADHTYVGLGGPFLEDFRLVHAQLGLTKLVSIEMDDSVLNRQKFNRPLSNIECLKATSGDFITNYPLDSNAIVWLDYAAAKEQRQQLEEFQQLLPKLRRYDVVKLTVNAAPDVLAGPTLPDTPEDAKAAEKLQRLWAARLAVLRERIGDLLPNDASAEQMTMKGVPNLLYRAILRAAFVSLQGLPDLDFLPITSFRYSDSAHQMLTVTGIVLGKAERKSFLSRTGISKWHLYIKDAAVPIHIEVPALSVRERLFVDARLPKRWNGKRISKALGFWCADNEDDSIAMLNSYAQFFRHLPYFSRVVP